jgi:general secretion pathway protein J
MMQRRARPGFTLIELLVAISILAIVAVLGWRGLDAVVRARLSLTEQIETTRGMQLAFAQMQNDAEQMADPAMLQSRPYLMADNGRMVLVRNVFTEVAPLQLQVVSYRVVDGVLTRRESAATRDLMQLDVLWKAATSDSDSTPPVILQKNITGMVVQTWDGNRWASPNAPPLPPNSPVAPPAGVTPLTPTGLQVSLQVKDVPAVMIKSFLLGGT